jgi:catecholate siderophore receptor
LIAENPNSSRLGLTGLDPAIQAIEGFNNRVRLNAAGTAFANDGFRRLSTSQNYLQQLNQAANPALRNFWRDYRMTDPSIYNFYEQMLEGPNKREWAFWKTFTTTFEQRLGRHAGVEVAYDMEKLDSGYLQPLQFRQNAINIDITTHLPNGLPNPNLGRPFHNTATGFVNSPSSEREAYRATAYYELSFAKLSRPWLAKLLGRHIFTGSFTNQNWEFYSFGGRLNTLGLDYQATKLSNPADRNIQVGSNERSVMRQSYLGPSLLNAASPQNGGIRGVTAPQNIDGASTLTGLYYVRPDASPVVLGPWRTGTFSLIQTPPYDFSQTTTGGDHNYEETKSVVFVSNNYWWDHTLVTTLGWREDRFQSQQAPSPAISPVTGLKILDRDAWQLAPGLDQKVSKFNYGLVLHLPPFLRGKLPLGADVSLTYNRSDNFQPGRQTYDIFNRALQPTTGTTEEWGTLVSLFRGKLELRAGKYQTASQGAANSSLGGTQTRLVQRLASQMSALRTAGYRDEVTTKGLASSLAAWDQFEKSPAAQSLFRTYKFKFSEGSNIVDKDERIGEVVSTSDILAEGYEFDLIFNPTSRWRIAVNAARQETVTGNTGLPLRELLAQLDPVWGGTAGQLPLSIGTNNTLRDDWGTTVNEVQKVILLDGTPSPELRRWRFNAVSNYSFKGGWLEGVRLGGAYRWQDKSAIGFPVRILPDGSAIADVTRPYMGKAETNVDAWIGYSRRLWSEKVRWNVQLNVKNIGQGNRLVAVSTQPDGRPDSPRIVTPQMVSLTTSFEF